MHQLFHNKALLILLVVVAILSFIGEKSAWAGYELQTVPTAGPTVEGAPPAEVTVAPAPGPGEGATGGGGLLDILRDNWIWLAGGGLVILAGGGLLVYGWLRGVGKEGGG
jgi:hypothetical protein